MSKNRYDASVDTNQPKIVERLRELSGVEVQVGMEDILVGYKGNNFQIEIKNPKRTLDKDGRITKDCFKKSQRKLMRDWTGQLGVAWYYEDCLEIIGYKG